VLVLVAEGPEEVEARAANVGDVVLEEGMI